jgi:hypothetical protein
MRASHLQFSWTNRKEPHCLCTILAMLVAPHAQHVIVTTFNVGCDVPVDCRTLVFDQEWAKRSIHNKGRFVMPISHLNLRTHVSAKVRDTSNGRVRIQLEVLNHNPPFNRKGMPPLAPGEFQQRSHILVKVTTSPRSAY